MGINNMKNEIKFSVIIPVFNCGEALRKCIDSFLSQTFESFELILVNDGSDDAITLEILDSYDRTENRVKVFHKENGGCVDARRHGIRQAKGKYVTFADGDDFVRSDYFEVLSQVVCHKADYYVLNNYRRFPNQEPYVEKVLTTGYTDIQWVKDFILGAKAAAIWDKIFLREHFGEEVSIIPMNITHGDDIYINIKYLQNIDNPSIYIADEAVYYHLMQTQTSVCCQPASFEHLRESEVIYDAGLDYLTALGNADARAKKVFLDKIYLGLARTIGRLYRQKGMSKKIKQKFLSYRMFERIPLGGVSMKGIASRVLLKYHMFWLLSIIIKR